MPQVKLKEYGSELIEVADNGSGIAEQDYQALTLKYHTSKISQLSDLEVCRSSNGSCGTGRVTNIALHDVSSQALASFGFRGEALSSLCAVSEVTVATRTEGSQTGTRLSYDHAGVLTGTAAAARSKGTTVAIRELFKPLPVRYKVIPKHLAISRAMPGNPLHISHEGRAAGFAGAEAPPEAGVCEAVGCAAGLCAHCSWRAHHLHKPGGASRYGMCSAACPDLDRGEGQRAVVQVGTGARTKVISTQGLASMRDNIITIFGGRTSEALKQLDGGTAEGIAFEGYPRLHRPCTTRGSPAGGLLPSWPDVQVCIRHFGFIREDWVRQAVLLPERPAGGHAQGVAHG